MELTTVPARLSALGFDSARPAGTDGPVCCAYPRCARRNAVQALVKPPEMRAVRIHKPQAPAVARPRDTRKSFNGHRLRRDLPGSQGHAAA